MLENYFGEISMKFHWNFSEILLKFQHNFTEIILQHFMEISPKYHRNVYKFQ